MKTEIQPFHQDMLAEAGKLLASRQARERAHFPALPKRFEDVSAATKAVETAFKKKGAFGFAAIRNGTLAAYLIGESTPLDWGRGGFIHLPGCGLAEGEDPALLQDLYAFVGEEWNKWGCFLHYLYLPSGDPAVTDSWFSLGFGRERADAILDLHALDIPKVKLKGSFEVRRSTAKDAKRLEELSDVIAVHQSRAPRWHPLTPEELPELAEGWSEIAGDPDWTIWLAVSGEETYGCVGFYGKPEADDALLVPPNSCYLSVAATKESERGRGVASALTWHGLERMRAEGFDFCLSDWQTANLPASRTWPRFGFETTAYRLARTVNPMIAWAKA